MEAGAPQIARLGVERPDGSPRISPVEPCLAGGCLLVGTMSWSRKAVDLRRDPRYALHSAIADPDSGTGELKLHGRAAIASPRTRHQAAAAWWSALPPQSAEVFVLGIEQALFVEWDIPHVMTVHRWSPGRGDSHSARIYP